MSITTTKELFRVHADHIRFPDQWFLDEPRTATDQEIDAREFIGTVPYRGPMPVVVPVGNPGRELAFNFGAIDMPVVSSEVADIVRGIARVEAEFLAVDVPGSKGKYQILNALQALDCLDEKQSEFTRWQMGDHRSDLAGQYRAISTIRIDPARTRGNNIFRIKNWTIALFVSAALKNALIGIPELGVVFDPVS
jgi:hypothetical protein